jgi:Ca2+-binding EF-hand superfamily protein
LLSWYKGTNTDAKGAALQCVLESMGQRPSDDQVQELIKVVDTDGGGAIGFDEFLTLMTQVLSLLALLVQKYKY